ncbi:butyrophilin subfamily 3 member A2-like [Centropristis striata]|uniref:butyrophilin subfamily 3 member A2-like n=1 Tax=Centropristis striata TaxID=184440 RepID=UPI0027DFBF7E|nr:butyrophilin subfamily 3 member A2-like [Centropristis striata]
MMTQKNGLSLPSPLKPLLVLVFHLLQTHVCTGQSQLTGPSQPIIATVGEDVILPCYLEPAADVAAKTLDWTKSKSDLSPEFVYVRRAGHDLVHAKHPSYIGRTSMFTDELKKGNISLKLSTVKPSDAGRYKCYIPEMEINFFVKLVVGAVSSPFIVSVNRTSSGLLFQCKSSGWYPEPEVLWLDGEGKLLSAGPTETVRGPDDLYTVSSRVTVEKRHSNSFTCRVHQKDTNHTTETHITVPDDFFEVRSSSTSTIAGLAVDQLNADIKKLQEEKQREEELKQKVEKELEDKKKELEEKENELKNQLKSKDTEIIQLENDQDGSKVKDLESSQSDDNSISQSSTTEPVVVVEVKEYSRYIHLRNTSDEEQDLEGWTLHVQFQNNENFTFTFKSFKLKAKETVTMSGYHSYNSLSRELQWEDLKSWSSNKLLQVKLVCKTGNVHYQLYSSNKLLQ